MDTNVLQEIRRPRSKSKSQLVARIILLHFSPQKPVSLTDCIYLDLCYSRNVCLCSGLLKVLTVSAIQRLSQGRKIVTFYVFYLFCVFHTMPQTTGIRPLIFYLTSLLNTELLNRTTYGATVPHCDIWHS